MNMRIKALSIVMTMLLLIMGVFEFNAEARAGGGRSMGSRGSRSYSSPSRSSSNPSGQQTAPAPGQQVQPQQQQAGGGFLRNFGGGLLGGLVGGMLFRSLGFGGAGGGWGGSGVGMFEIILILGGRYFLYRMVKRKREKENLSYQTPYQQNSYSKEGLSAPDGREQSYTADSPAVNERMSDIRQIDPNFDERLFKDRAMDVFFKIQGAWMNRELSPVNSLLTDEMRNNLQGDVDQLLKEKKINRLENIAVRNVDIVESWREAGQDFITVLFYANLLDYTTSDTTGEVLAGSKLEPVKFEEYWTFTRAVGDNTWRLSALNQG
jgi:predicted lipid-binding transport protein (Tim44 family)